ncbi:MAG: hypothetical protein JKX85_00735 [Phycisphaeraceae bacterium]|nr:hypothetical protein [Phycisphaeraceae bacterium]
MPRTLIAITLLLALTLPVAAQSLVSVPLDSQEITFKGARYIEYGKPYASPSEQTGPQFVMPLRFSQPVLKTPIKVSRFNSQTAQWSAGIELHLVTDSTNIVIAFKIQPARRGRPGICQVYQDNRLLKDYPIKSAKKNKNAQIHIKSADDKKHHYRIMLPATMALQITSLQIDKGSKLDKVSLPSKPIYVAMGDSITHGSAGIDGITTKSFAYLLATKLNYDLYNLGIGGGRVSPMLGTMLKDWKKIDLITLLIGYNDLSWAGVPVANYQKYYLDLLTEIRKSHPNTPLFCLTLTFTKLKKSPKTGITPEEYRNVVRSLVKTFQQQGDKNIHLVEGEPLTDISGLNDPVHFNTKGNQDVAKRLGEIITTQLAQ